MAFGQFFPGLLRNPANYRRCAPVVRTFSLPQAAAALRADLADLHLTA
jgi:hypothetical protein